MAYLAHIIRWLNPCYMEIKPFVWLIYMVASIDNCQSRKRWCGTFKHNALRR